MLACLPPSHTWWWGFWGKLVTGSARKQEYKVRAVFMPRESDAGGDGGGVVPGGCCWGACYQATATFDPPPLPLRDFKVQKMCWGLEKKRGREGDRLSYTFTI